MTEPQENWEREALVEIATQGLIEQRRDRFWRNLFKILLSVYLLALLVGSWMLTLPLLEENEDHIAVVKINGEIGPGSDASADKINVALRKAFKAENSQAILLRINSPGGSPVQSGRIYDEIQRLRKKHPEKPVYAVIDDLCASGGYYVATAADKIYADKASLIGSIGVRMDSFGFVGTLDKLGIERRTLTAGENKALLDPFAPANPEANVHLQGMLNEIHDQFITAVKEGRGGRLKETDDLFSGLIWTGQQSVALGLIDELSDVDAVSRELMDDPMVLDYTLRPGWMQQVGRQLGASLRLAVSGTIEQPRFQ